MVDDYSSDVADDETLNSSESVLAAIAHSRKVFSGYNAFCDRIDAIYSARAQASEALDGMGLTDRAYDLFWASTEVLKPAIYAKPPRVVSKTRYSDASATDKTCAEMIERVVNSEFERSNIDQVMLGLRDDLALLNRGVPWVILDEYSGDKAVCAEHVDREDFAHDPARYWLEVGWAARRSYLTKEEMGGRFRKYSGNAYLDAFYGQRENREAFGSDSEAPYKAEVWEFWDKARNRVVWVSEGVDVFLDEQPPHVDVPGFFPCPRPAYGTLQRRSLIPVPDYRRYETHFDQINSLTGRIYDLLDCVRMKGLIAAGGDVGSAVETAMADVSSSQMLIPVPGAALMNGGDMVQWLPLDMLANTITGLIQAREQLFADFDRLSGISDIMRGETESDETLGAQRLKSQYGSVRIKDRTNEMVRVARDCARIAADIICDNFTQKQLLEISQMSIPTKKEVEKAIKDLEKAARSEMEALTEQATQAAEQAQMEAQGQVPPEVIQQAEQAFAEAQAQIAQKYEPKLQEYRNTVVIEDVMQTLKDNRTRALLIDIETDSTVMTDEIAEKQSRSDFLSAFSNATGAVMPLMQAGEAGAKLAGAMIKFALQPYNAGRELDSVIDDFIEQAPAMAAAMQGNEGDDQGLAEANKMLAEAENTKAQAAMASVQARAAQAEADNQRKMAEMQMKQQNDMQKAEQENAKLRLQLEKQMQEGAAKDAETQAKINHLTAQTAAILESIGLDVRKQELEEYKAVAAQQDKQIDRAVQQENMATDRAMGQERNQVEDEFRARGEDRADRQFEEGGE